MISYRQHHYIGINQALDATNHVKY